MSKGKLIIGITIIVFGAALIFTNLFIGIKETVKNDFDEAVAFPVTFERLISQSSPGFYIDPGQKTSVWIRMPHREVENKNFSFYVTVINEAGETVKQMAEDFSAGYFRSSYGQGQFYRIGTFRPKTSLRGLMIYQSGGEWAPRYGAELVLRKEKGMKASLTFIFGLMVGITLVVLGIMRLSLKD